MQKILKNPEIKLLVDAVTHPKEHWETVVCLTMSAACIAVGVLLQLHR
jgi:hypothetical protein